MKELKTIRFGVNYVPSKKWWYAWNDFDQDAIAEDLDAITELGADHIRMMMVWPWVQPNPRTVSQAHLDRLDVIMMLAAERKLEVCVTMLTGWLSGWAFRPVFDNPEGFFTDSKIRTAIEVYFRAVAERTNRHENFMGFDLGNELNYCWRTDNLNEGDLWNEAMLQLCKKLSPGKLHVNGTDHRPWFMPSSFSPHGLASSHDVISLHCWIQFTGALKRSAWNEAHCTHLVPAMAALARQYAGVPDKPIWLQEFGASEEWVGAENIPVFLELAARNAIEAGVGALTWWSSHDVGQQYEFDSLEYDLGLIDTDNQLKPAGKIFQRLAREFGGKPVTPFSGLVPDGLPAHTHEDTWAWLESYLKLNSLL